MKYLAILISLVITFAVHATELEDAKTAAQKGDFATAKIIYEKLSAENNAKAQYNLAVMHASGDGAPANWNEALKYFKLSAENGYVEAQFKMALVSFKGEGMPIDYDASLHYYEIAAKQGHVRSQLNLGSLYANGEVVAKDDDKAYFWLHKAASQNDADAQYLLGRHYFYGEGVKENLVLAHLWFNLSVQNSHDHPNRTARRNMSLQEVIAKMTPEQIAQSNALALTCVSNKFENCN